MKQLRSIFIIGFSMALFIGNTVGLDVFKHFCKVDRTTSYSYITPDEDHCFGAQKPSNDQGCCVEEQEPVEICCEKEQNSEEGCCEDEIIHVHLDLDYANEYSDLRPTLIFDELPSVDFILAKRNFEKRVVTFALQPNPPPLKSSERRSLQQVFIV